MYLVGNVLSLFFCLSSGLFLFLLKEMFLDVCYVASRWVSWNLLEDSWILLEMGEGRVSWLVRVLPRWYRIAFIAFIGC